MTTIHNVFSPKGGVGTSTAAALYAHHLSNDGDTLIIDVAGDMQPILGWAASDALNVQVQPGLDLTTTLHCNREPYTHVVIDWGVQDDPQWTPDGRKIAVVNNHYMTLWRWTTGDLTADEYILVRDPEWALDTRDVERVMSPTVHIATVDRTVNIGRCVDAGLLLYRQRSEFRIHKEATC